MSGSEGKASPRPVIVAHIKTLSNANTGNVRATDHFLMFGVPLVATIVVAVTTTTFDGSLLTGLVTVTGLAGAFFFGLMVQHLQAIMSWADSDPEPGTETSRHAKLLAELAANAAYASLLAFTASVLLVFAAVADSDAVKRSASALVAFVLTHFVLTVLMVIRRVFLLSIERINDVRTGARRSRSSSSRRG